MQTQVGYMLQAYKNEKTCKNKETGCKHTDKEVYSVIDSEKKDA